VPRTVIPVLAGLLAGLLFVTANVAALRAPQPHGVPIGIEGAPAEPLQRALDGEQPGGYVVARVANAVAAVRHRDAYAAVDATAGELVTGGANGATTAMTLEQALATAATAVGVQAPRTRDVAPLKGGDPRGLSLPQIVLGTIIGGFLMGVLTAQLVLGEPLWQRLTAYAGFAVAFGFLAAVVLDPVLGALSGHFALVWLWVSVTSGAIAISVGAAARLLGQAGVPLAMVAFLVLGNPSAGASAPTEFLPGLFRTVGPWLPPNAAASGLLGTTYFDADVLRPGLVLGLWIAAALAVLTIVDRRRGSRRALAYDAAGAATDRADRDAPEPGRTTA
jgi:hypothetical protein